VFVEDTLRLTQCSPCLFGQNLHTPSCSPREYQEIPPPPVWLVTIKGCWPLLAYAFLLGLSLYRLRLSLTWRGDAPSTFSYLKSWLIFFRPFRL
jgi:hypothetical protein